MNKIKNKNDYLYIGLFKLIKVFIFLMSLLLLFRIFFTIYFGEPNVLEQYELDLLKSYMMGFKYDCLVISYAVTPSFLLLTLVSLTKNNFINNFYTFLNRFYFLFITLFIIIISICDLGFYSFFQDHINILFFGIIEDDTVALFESIKKNYPLEIGLTSVFAFALGVYFLLRKIFTFTKHVGSQFNSSIPKFLSLTIIVLLLLVGGLRGGYGKLVIAPKYSEVSENEFINQISLNGLISLEKAYKVRKLSNSDDTDLYERLGYQSISQALSDYLGMKVNIKKDKEFINSIKLTTSKNLVSKKIRPNVIVIVMESFGANWMKYNSENFNFLSGLERHFSEDILFKNTLSSDNGTIGSLLSIATNIPNRPGARFLSESKYLRTPLDSSSNIPFKKNGYETTFYYGGKLGWRDIGKYFKYQKFDNVIGENSISSELNLNGRNGTEWGLYDEHLFESIYRRLKSKKSPQFIMALSTSNHPPFETPKDYNTKSLLIPEKLNDKILRERSLFLERFKAFQYANSSLSNLLDKIKNSSLAENTIVAVTGDHNFWGFINYSLSDAFAKHTVPLYFYIPKSLMAVDIDNSKFASHIDIMPSLYNLALSETDYISFGTNLFTQSKGIAIGANVIASRRGVIYKNKSYEWNNIPYIKQRSEKKFDELRKYYNSLLSISDYFIKINFQKTRN